MDSEVKEVAETQGGENSDRASQESPAIDTATWVEEYGDFLYRSAYLRVGRREVAEDLVQETFLAAIQGLESFAGRSSVKTWLYGILRNKAIDYLRKSNREIPVVMEETSEEENQNFSRFGIWSRWVKKWSEDPDQLLSEKGFVSALEKCLLALPERSRQIFMLKVLDGKDSEEICKELDISPSNSWVLTYRARLALRTCLDRSWYNPR